MQLGEGRRATETVDVAAGQGVSRLRSADVVRRRGRASGLDFDVGRRRLPVGGDDDARQVEVAGGRQERRITLRLHYTRTNNSKTPTERVTMQNNANYELKSK